MPADWWESEMLICSQLHIKNFVYCHLEVFRPSLLVHPLFDVAWPCVCAISSQAANKLVFMSCDKQMFAENVIQENRPQDLMYFTATIDRTAASIGFTSQAGCVSKKLHSWNCRPTHTFPSAWLLVSRNGQNQVTHTHTWTPELGMGVFDCWRNRSGLELQDSPIVEVWDYVLLMTVMSLINKPTFLDCGGAVKQTK